MQKNWTLSLHWGNKTTKYLWNKLYLDLRCSIHFCTHRIGSFEKLNRTNWTKETFGTFTILGLVRFSDLVVGLTLDFLTAWENSSLQLEQGFPIESVKDSTCFAHCGRTS